MMRQTTFFCDVEQFHVELVWTSRTRQIVLIIEWSSATPQKWAIRQSLNQGNQVWIWIGADFLQNCIGGYLSSASESCSNKILPTEPFMSKLMGFRRKTTHSSELFRLSSFPRPSTIIILKSTLLNSTFKFKPRHYLCVTNTWQYGEVRQWTIEILF